MTKKNNRKKKALKMVVEQPNYVVGSILKDDEKREDDQEILEQTFRGYTSEMTIDPELYRYEKLTILDRLLILLQFIFMAIVAILFAPIFFFDLYMRTFLKTFDINYCEELNGMKKLMRERNYRKRMEIDKK